MFFVDSKITVNGNIMFYLNFFSGLFKTINLRILLIFKLLAILSCNNKNIDLYPSNKPQHYIELKKNNFISIRTFDSLFDQEKIISLRTPDSLLIASISKIIIYKKRIYILDKKFSNVSCFDENGNFLLQYGKIGLSGNDYQKIQDFDIDYSTNQLVIFSNENRILYYYSLDKGIFHKKNYVGVYAHSFSVLPFNRLIFYIDYKTNEKMPGYNVLITDSAGQIIYRSLPFNANLSTIGWALTTGFLNRSDSQVFFSDAFSDSIYSYNNNKISLFAFIDINSDSIQTNRINHQKLFYSGITIDSSSAQSA